MTLISLYTTVNRAKQAAGVTEIMTISLFNTLVMNYCVQYNLFYPAFVDPDIETIRVSVSLKFAVSSRSYRKVNNTLVIFLQ